MPAGIPIAPTQPSMPMPSPAIKQRLPYLAIALALLLLFIALSTIKPVRVGDGAEYYAMFQAWQTGHRPWIDAATWQAYDAVFRSQAIASMVPTDILAHAFSTLRVGDTADMNHFWFYSLLAFVCHQAAALFGLYLSAHASFLMLHWVLLTITAALAYRHYRWPGVAGVALIVFGSPLFWFTDKVHTELMTVCTVLCAVILFRAQRYLAAFAFLAVAATQNPSFALVACLPLACRVGTLRDTRITAGEVLVFLAFSALILVHPLYYHSRYGVATPTMLSGGMAAGANLHSFYVWIVDPDLGLLPNWPLGLLALVTAGVVWLRTRGRAPRQWDRTWLLFLAGYLAINFYAQSSTTNLNSGATPGLARYALWYLPLAFPLFLWLARSCRPRSRGFYAALPVLAVLVAVSLNLNQPRRPERYTDPSMSSRLVQNNLPALYNPPPEVFLERYSGLGESIWKENPKAVLGPDCRKMLVLQGAARHAVVASSKCMFDRSRLAAWVNSAAFEQALGPAPDAATYIRMPEARAALLQMKLVAGVHSMQAGAEGRQYLESGWGAGEDWGVWSDRAHANLLIPCDGAQPGAYWLGLTLRPFGRQRLAVSADGAMLWDGVLDGADQVVRFALPAHACSAGYTKIELTMPGALTPRPGDPASANDLRALGLVALDVKAM